MAFIKQYAWHSVTVIPEYGGSEAQYLLTLTHSFFTNNIQQSVLASARGNMPIHLMSNLIKVSVQGLKSSLYIFLNVIQPMVIELENCL